MGNRKEINEMSMELLLSANPIYKRISAIQKDNNEYLIIDHDNIKANVTEAIKKLIELEYIKPDGEKVLNDPRGIIHFYLTDKGLQVIEKIKELQRGDFSSVDLRNISINNFGLSTIWFITIFHIIFYLIYTIKTMIN